MKLFSEHPSKVRSFQNDDKIIEWNIKKIIYKTS